MYCTYVSGVEMLMGAFIHAEVLEYTVHQPCKRKKGAVGQKRQKNLGNWQIKGF